MKLQRDTRLARRFIAELLLVGFVSVCFETSISLASTEDGMVQFLKSLDGKIFLGACGLVITSIMWNPFASICELKMTCSGKTSRELLFKRVLRNLPRSVYLLLFGVNSAVAVNRPELISGDNTVWIQDAFLNLMASIAFLIYAIDKLWIFRDLEHSFLDKLLGITFERT